MRDVMRKRTLIGLMLASVVVVPALEAATPPAIVNYQGVLLNAGGGPENGDRDMIFHFYDSSVAGNEILRDKHLLADAKQVSVMTGLFNVPLGTGVIEDGSGVFPDDPYDSLDKVFRGFQAVYLELEVRTGPAGGAGSFETLSPRTRVMSSPYALNAMDAGALNGMSAGTFINTSATAQTKAGSLTIGGALQTGSGLYTAGDLSVSNGIILLGNPGGTITASDLNMSLTAGNADTDSLDLRAGNTADDGQIHLSGDGIIEFRAGNGLFSFVNGNTAAETAALDASGNLQIDGALQTGAGFQMGGDLTVSGDDILFGSAGALVSVTPTNFSLNAGDADTDSLFLTAGNSLDDGRITLVGDGRIELRAGDGVIRFVNGNTSLQTAQLDPSGNFQIAGAVTVSGDDILFGSAGAKVSVNSSALSLTAGDADIDDLYLNAGNSFDDGQIALTGDGAIQMRAGNGAFLFVNGSTGLVTGELDASGDLEIESLGIGAPGSASQPTTVGMESFGAVLTIRTINSMETNLDNDNSTPNEFARWCMNGNCTGSNQLMRLEAATGNLLVNGSVVPNSFDLAEIYLKGEEVGPGDIVRIDPLGRNAVVRSSGAGDHAVLGIVSEKPGIVLGGMPAGVDALERTWGPEVKARYVAEKDGLVHGILHAEPSREAAFSQMRAALAASAKPAGLEQRKRELTSLQDDLDFDSLQAFYARHFVPVALAGRVPVKVDTQYGAIAAGDALAPSPIPGVAMKDDGQGPVIGIALESFTGGRGKVVVFVVRGQGVSAEIIGRTRALAEQVEQRTPEPGTGVQEMSGHLQIVLDKDADDEARLSVFRDGEDDQMDAEVFRVDEDGNVFAKGSFRPNAMDVAELFGLSERAEPGDVLAADPVNPGRFRPAREESDITVIGVVASQPGMLLGSGVDRILASDTALAARLEEARRANDRQAEAKIWRQLESGFVATHAAVAMTGTVSVKADAGYGVIRAGDLLCSSSTPGHAMRSDDARPGTILGKALDPLESGTGLVRILVMLR